MKWIEKNMHAWRGSKWKYSRERGERCLKLKKNRRDGWMWWRTRRNVILSREVRFCMLLSCRQFLPPFLPLIFFWSSGTSSSSWKKLTKQRVKRKGWDYQEAEKKHHPHIIISSLRLIQKTAEISFWCLWKSCTKLSELFSLLRSLYSILDVILLSILHTYICILLLYQHFYNCTDIIKS